MPCVLPGAMLQGPKALWGCPLWLAVSHLPFLSPGSISPLPLQTDACVSVWALPSGHSWGGSTRGSLGEGESWRLQEGSRCAWVLLPAGAAMTGITFGTSFKAWAFWMQNLSPPRAFVLLQFFQFSWFAPHGFLWMLSLAKRTKREKEVFCTCLGWLVTSHLAVVIENKISAKFPSEKCFRESALWLGNASLLPLLVC